MELAQKTDPESVNSNFLLFFKHLICQLYECRYQGSHSLSDSYITYNTVIIKGLQLINIFLKEAKIPLEAATNLINDIKDKFSLFLTKSEIVSFEVLNLLYYIRGLPNSCELIFNELSPSYKNILDQQKFSWKTNLISFPLLYMQ